jgi:hypothetical protein
MDDKIRTLIDEGKWINAEIIIEVQGNDEKHMKEALDALLERLEKEEKVKVYGKEYSKTDKLDTGLLSQHVDIKLVARDFGKMVYVALMYSPSNVEVFSPKNITVDSGEAQNILADISSVVVSLAHSVFAKQGEINRMQGTAPSQKKD